MMGFRRFKNWVFGPPLSVLNPGGRKHILLVSFLAWIGLGADGLSSSCYGPEQAFLALGPYSELGLYIAVATALTVFIIAFSYNQVIELFPMGGGGYKVASSLIGPFAGLVSGSALIVDYVLTITISIASGVDALFSLLHHGFQPYKGLLEVLLIIILILLNLRGAKESIKVLMPIFLGFFISHLLLIIYGIAVKGPELLSIIPATGQDTLELSKSLGVFFIISLLMKAYSLGGGTYTGIEAVSNNINILAEPRVRTGKFTMFYMAVSLSLIAGGIILLYLLWQVIPQSGKTLNAVTFSNIMQNWRWNDWHLSIIFLPIILFFEASLLFVAANTGFLGGPAVLANMASDSWLPSQFRHLSSRLVTQNGILFMGISAIILLVLTGGDVSVLVVLYSLNVFITFSLSLYGLTIHWWKKRKGLDNWGAKILLSAFGFLVTSSILLIILYEKFFEGAWHTVLITGFIILLCYFIKRHYDAIAAALKTSLNKFYQPSYLPSSLPPKINPQDPTAIIIVDETLALGMHTLYKVLTLFPNIYKNYIFISVGEIDYREFGKEEELHKLKHSINDALHYYVNFCHHQGKPAALYQRYGTDIIESILELAQELKEKYPNSIFFSGDILIENENWLTAWLHDHTPALIQRALHLNGIQVVLLPMKIRV